MKKFKNSFIIISLLLILTSCQNPTPEPLMKVSSGSDELKVMHYLNINNKDKEDIERGIKTSMVGKRFTDLPTIDFGEKIEIEAVNFETSEVEVFDYIVDESGNIISDYSIGPFATPLVTNGNAEFIFEKDDNLEMYNNYKVEGNNIHCLLMRCKIDKSSYAFGIFILSGCSKTDGSSEYINQEYGFSMNFPESWSEEFEINPYDYGLIISSEVNDITTLAYIHNYTIPEWEELNNGTDLPVPYQILEENKEEVFTLIYPGDVNYDIENEKSVKKYEEMILDLQEGNFTFELNN